MQTTRTFISYKDFDAKQLEFTLSDRNGKPLIHATCGPARNEIALITAPAITLWPRVDGDGNFGTMWGPTDVQKAKFTLDLNDSPINEKKNEDFAAFASKIELVDDALLDFVHEHQLKILGRKNLSRDEVKMLQIRTVRPKFDKMSGQLTGHTVNMSASKFAWNGMGGKYERKITICDSAGQVVPNAQVCPGDVVSATMYANQIYTGVGGDKFGIHWAFQDVAVVCQRAALEQKSEVTAFQGCGWSMAKPYDSTEQVSELKSNDQFRGVY